jgi:hypothetical protein
MAHTLIVLPDDTARPIGDAIAAASLAAHQDVRLFASGADERRHRREPARRQGLEHKDYVGS